MECTGRAEGFRAMCGAGICSKVLTEWMEREKFEDVRERACTEYITDKVVASRIQTVAGVRW